MAVTSFEALERLASAEGLSVELLDGSSCEQQTRAALWRTIEGGWLAHGVLCAQRAGDGVVVLASAGLYRSKQPYRMARQSRVEYESLESAIADMSRRFATLCDERRQIDSQGRVRESAEVTIETVEGGA